MPTQTRPDSVSVWGPNREWWVYQPGPRLGICLEEGIHDFVFHQKTYQFKPNMALSPSKHLDLLGQQYPWRAILIDYNNACALLYTRDSGWAAPAAVFPVFSATQDLDTLLTILDAYVTDGLHGATFTGSPKGYDSVPGQEYRILITNLSGNPRIWEDQFRDLMEAKRQFPHVTFHVSGQKSIPKTLATGIDSFDHPVTLEWRDERPVLLLANGRYLSYEKYQETNDHTKWARLAGMTARSVFEAPDRATVSKRMYLFNLRSLKWAFSTFDQAWSMNVVDESQVDPNDPDSAWIPIDLRYQPRSTQQGDKWICDLCSISDRCPYSRPGAICIVDKTEAASLAEKFKTRSSHDIVDGLGILLGAQTERAARAMQAETDHNQKNPDDQRFSPEVTKMLQTVFDQGNTLARLVDPSLGQPVGRGRKAINASSRSAVAAANPKDLAAAFKGELQSAGIDITKLSPDEAQELLARIMPSGSVDPHVDADDAPEGAQEVAVRRDPVAPSPSTFRAAPRLDPGVPGA